jgi:thioredoxin-related protein
VEQGEVHENMHEAVYRIEKAVETASKENKRILLIFGARWCVWCRALHHLLTTNTDVTDVLEKYYEVVSIDVGHKDKNMDINEKYGNPIENGLPVIVVLDEEGNYLTTQETGTLECEDETVKMHEPSKVLDFLTLWALQ